MKQKSEIYFPEGRWISLWNLNDEISGQGAEER